MEIKKENRGAHQKWNWLEYLSRMTMREGRGFETTCHYIRKWENKDISELKLLIEISIRWIESEEYTRIYKEQMPWLEI